MTAQFTMEVSTAVGTDDSTPMSWHTASVELLPGVEVLRGSGKLSCGSGSRQDDGSSGSGGGGLGYIYIEGLVGPVKRQEIADGVG